MKEEIKSIEKKDKKKKGKPIYKMFYKANDKTLSIESEIVEMGTKKSGAYIKDKEWGELEYAQKRLEVYKENTSMNIKKIEDAKKYKEAKKFIEEYEKAHSKKKK